jgi:hypothetical protein
MATKLQTLKLDRNPITVRAFFVWVHGWFLSRLWERCELVWTHLSTQRPCLVELILRDCVVCGMLHVTWVAVVQGTLPLFNNLQSLTQLGKPCAGIAVDGRLASRPLALVGSHCGFRWHCFHVTQVATFVHSRDPSPPLRFPAL